MALRDLLKEFWKDMQRGRELPGRWGGVIYGHGPALWGPRLNAEGFVWYCGRCRLGDDGYTTLADAELEARKHAAPPHKAVTVHEGEGVQ